MQGTAKMNGGSVGSERLVSDKLHTYLRSKEKERRSFMMIKIG